MWYRTAALVSITIVLSACDEGGTPTDPAAATSPEAVTTGAEPTAGAVSCPNCTFEPVLLVRATGEPVTHIITFEGNPDGAYILETDDLNTRGANSTIVLNGERSKPPRGVHEREVVLAGENELHVRLTGKPGSKLRVRIYQDVASVVVTPGSGRARIPASQQFTATAYDRNGVTIPRQTFTWESAHDTIATVDSDGLARTVGIRHDNDAFSYKTQSLGEGVTQITARADGAPDKHDSSAWTVVNGFVYVTWQAPTPNDIPDSVAPRPLPLPFHYDELRLQVMAATCATESSTIAWREYGPVERKFHKCSPELGLFNDTREWVPPTPLTDGFYIAGPPSPNAGLYGRYCGGGQPDGDWWNGLATAGNYQPIDPIDGICMEHDGSLAYHNENPAGVQATCIVRYGIEQEQLFEEGVLVQPGSARWNAFWSRWPDMDRSRTHWLVTTRETCTPAVYTVFRAERGLL